MIPLLAEISDKMPSAAHLWLWAAVVSVPAILGIVRKSLAWAVLLGAFVFSGWQVYGAYHEAFLEGTFSHIVQTEMGSWWIANSIASSLLPASVAFLILARHMRKRHAIPEPARRANGRQPSRSVSV